MKTKYTVFFLPLLLFSLFAINGWGQLATWNNGNVATNMPIGATAIGVNAAATSTSRTGLSYTSSGARWNSASWNSAANCITITVTAATGYRLNLNGATVTFNMGSSGTGPTSYSLKSSIDAYGSIIANVTTVNGSSVQQGDKSYTLPSTNYNGLSSITFKLFGNGSSSGTGTGGPSKVVVGGTAVLACTPTSSTVTDSVCSNLLPYIWHSQSIAAGGTNVATYTTLNAGGCDSVVHLNLVVKNTHATTINDTIYNNQLPYIWHGITLTDGGVGIVQQYLQNISGCDSIVTLNLVVRRPNSTVNDTICSSSFPYTWHGNILNAGGLDVAQDTVPSAIGCDSIIHLNLIVKATTSSTVNDTICSSSLPYTWHGLTVNAGGLNVARDTLLNANGCDSIIHLNLIVKATSSSIVNDTICNSSLPYIWHGTVVNAGGLNVAKDTVLNASGCDSIIHLNLVVKPTSSSVVNDTICSNSLPYTWHGLTVNAGGLNVARDTLLNANGCDSIIHLNLTVKIATSSVVNDTICSSSLPYSWHGIIVNAGGLNIAQDTLLNANGCDSVLHLNLYVKSTSSHTVNDTICNTALPYLWHGVSVAAAGLNIAQDTLVNAAGCDSILHLNLYIKSASNAVVKDTICNSALPYLWHGTSVSFGGLDVAQYTLVNANGCDSIIHLNLYVRPAIHSIVNDTICNTALPYLWHGTSVATGGLNMAQYTLVTAGGCDSILHLNLYVKQASSYTVNDTVCNNALPYIWHSKVVNAGGLDVAKDTVMNASGCDSIIHLNLYIKPTIHSVVKDTICNNALPYLWHGTSVGFAGSDVARDTLLNASGCDSIIHLNLTVKASSSAIVNETICSSSLPYTWHGTVINIGGLDVARYTVPNANGCDSTIHLNLTVKATSSQVDNRTTCHQLPFIWNGLTVNTSGTNAATYHTLNANGCDSTVSLNLTVSVDTTQNNITINSTALPYTWHGINIPAGGTAVATYTLQSSMGCDSVLVLNLTVTSTPVPVTLISFNGRTNNTNNSLSWTTTDEINLSHYELERSNDQQHFVGIVKLLTETNSSAQHTYTYNDAGIGNDNVLYYRLKMVDADGKFRYSSIVTLKRNTETLAIKSYPNPAATILNIEGLRGKVSYYVTDATGRLVLQAHATNITEKLIKVNVASLIGGAYFLHYQDGNSAGVIRFIKR